MYKYLLTILFAAASLAFAQASPPAPATWASGGELRGVTIGELKLVPRMKRIGFELPITEQGGTVMETALRFRKTSEGGSGRAGLPPVVNRFELTEGPTAVRGSVLLCDSGEQYELLVGLRDDAGNWAWRYGAVATLADDIPPAAALVPNRFVDAVNGSDDNPGDAPDRAWKTFRKAATSYAKNDVIQFAPGFYTSDGEQFNRGPVTLVAQHPAIDDERNVINAGRHTIIEPPAVTSPAGSGGPNAGVWVKQQGIQGPGRYGSPGRVYDDIWKWSGCPVADPCLGSYAAGRSDLPQRLPKHERDDDYTATVEGWAEALHENSQYSYGFWSDGQGNVYARLPGDIDPNTQWMWFSPRSSRGIRLADADSRASGLIVHTFQSAVYTASNTVIDHCWLNTSLRGVEAAGQVEEVMVQYCRFEDTNQFSLDHANHPAISWDIIKGAYLMPDGTAYGRKPCRYSESTAVYASSGASKMTMRYCTAISYFNGFGVHGGRQGSDDLVPGGYCDAYGNHFQNLADDALEPEGQLVNYAAWDNRADRTLSFLSTGPVHIGPVYFFRNVGWRMGSEGAGRRKDGTVKPSGKVFKFGSGSDPRCTIFVLHNTFWLDQVDPNVVTAAGDSAGGSIGGVRQRDRFYMLNNIVRTSGYVLKEADAGQLIEDHNVLVSSHARQGVVYGGKRFAGEQQSIADYRAASGQGAHSNRLGDASYGFNDPAWLKIVDESFVDAAGGDLTLRPDAPLRGLGTPVPNLSDRPGIDYQGAAPNLGHVP